MPFETELSPEIAQIGRLDPVSVGPITTGNTTILAAPGAFLRRRIFRVYLGNNGSATVIVNLRHGNFGEIALVSLAADGGGVILNYGKGAILQENRGLIAALPAGGPFSVFVNVLEHSTVAA